MKNENRIDYARLYEIIGEDNKSNEALIVNRSQIENVFSAIPGGLVMYRFQDGTMETLYISPEALKMVGVDIEEYNKAADKISAMDRIFTSDKEHMMRMLYEGVEKSESLSFNIRIIGKNEEIIWVNVKGVALKQNDGSIIYCGVAQNIDRYSDPYKDLLNHVNEMVFIMDFYSKEVLYVNNKVKEVFFGSADLKLGQTGYDIFGEEGKECELCDTDKFIDKDHALYEVCYRGRTYKVKSNVITHYGRKFVISCMIDITEYRMFRTSFDATVEMLTCARIKCRKNADFTVVEANETFYKMTGYTPEEFKELKNNSFAAIIPESYISQIVSAVDANLDKTDFNKNEFCFICKDGSVKYVIDQSAVAVEDGQEYIYSTFMDITERKLKETVIEERYQQELKRKNAMLKELIAYCEINVTNDRVTEWSSASEPSSNVKEGMTIEEALLSLGHEGTPTQKTQEFILKNLSRDILLKRYNKGDKNFFTEFYFRYEEGNGAWLSIETNLHANPETKDIEAFLYFKDIDQKKQIDMVINKEISDEYDLIVCIDVLHNSCVARLSNPSEKNNVMFFPNYDKQMVRYIDMIIVPEDKEFIREKTDIPNILSELERSSIYSFIFPETMADGVCRYKKFKYSYLDKEKKLIMLTRREVTDVVENSLGYSLVSEDGTSGVSKHIAAQNYVNKYKQIGEEILKHANVDTLTGLLNVNGFNIEAKKLIKEHPDENIFIIRRDINNFKAFNELYGRSAGDDFLAYIGRQYKKVVEEIEGCSGYLGGDDFISCYVGSTIEKIEAKTKKINDFITAYPIDYKFIISTGIYVVQDKSMPITTMCDRVELALNQAKKNAEPYCVYDETIRANIIRSQEIVNSFPEALKQRQFKLYLQPQYNMVNGKIVGAEALVRWIHPKKGMISPGEFIPVLEQNGLITQLDNYIAEEAYRVMALLKKSIPNAIPPSIAVNLSRADIINPSLIDNLNEKREKYGLNTSDVRLEITESLYVEHPEVMLNIVNGLRDLGYTVEMDDFGSGYSSLNTLKDISLDLLKLDMAFLSAINTRKGAKIVESVVYMANMLNLPVLTEGVETKEQLDFLVGIGCKYAQGYYFAKPMPIEDYINLLISSEFEKMD